LAREVSVAERMGYMLTILGLMITVLLFAIPDRDKVLNRITSMEAAMSLLVDQKAEIAHLKETDAEILRLLAQMKERQEANTADIKEIEQRLK